MIQPGEASRPAGWIEGTAAGLAVLTKQQDAPAMVDKSTFIKGTCHVESDGEQKSCADIYILVKHGDDESRIWVDDLSQFRIPMIVGEKYEIKAVSESCGLESLSQEFTRPAVVTLSLRQKRILSESKTP